MQGPWSPALKDYLTKHHRSYDALIFFTYLYAPTVLGLRVDPGRSILVPTAHDEPAIHLGIYKEHVPAAGGDGLQHRGRAGVPQDPLRDRRRRRGSRRLRRRPDAGGDAGGQGPREDRGPERALPSAIAAAMALDEPAVATADDDDSPAHLTHRGARFQRRHRLHGQFLLYGGRIDPGKGCEELLEYFTSYKEQAGDADLVLMGVKLMQLPEVPWVRFAGLLSERERLEALEAATIVVVPSPFESLSLLALEAMAVGTPVLCNGHSDVLVEHCRRSQAGLWYDDRDEFVDAAKLLLADDRLRRTMGRNGKEYVKREYRWDVIMAKYDRLIAAVAAALASVADQR